MTRPQKSAASPLTRRFSAIAGCVLVVFALLWFSWLLLRQINPTLGAVTLPLPGSYGQNTPASTSEPLTAAGITLTQPVQGQEPTLTRQEALLLAGQLEPSAAAHAGTVAEQYTLFSYGNPSATQKSFQNVPIWLIHYSKISEPPPDTAADPHASAVHHDVYIFLDAGNGQELLDLWF